MKKSLIPGVLAVAIAATGLGVAADTGEAAAEPPNCDLIAWVASEGGSDQVFVADSYGNGRKQISKIDDDSRFPHARSPEWSPDGSRIAFSTTLGDEGIVVTDPDGGNPSIITDLADIQGVTSFHEHDPTWSPDGTQIAWSGDFGRRNIYAANADGSNARVVYTTPGFDNSLEPDWSGTGTQIAFWGAEGLKIVSSTGGSASTIDDDWARSPVYSPDGTMLAWQGRDQNGLGVLWVANPNGSGRRVATPGFFAVTGAAWSPDSRRIAFSAGELSGPTSLFHISVDDPSDWHRISELGTGSNKSPVWSPDGTEVAWLQDGDLVVAELDGSNFRGIATVDDGPGVVGGQVPDWTTAVPGFSFERDVDGTIAVGETVTVELAVNASCSANGVTIDNAAPPCLRQLEAETSEGTVDQAGRWMLDSVDGTETATITGVVSVIERCSATTRVDGRDGTLYFSATNIVPDCPEAMSPFLDVSEASFAIADVACLLALEITRGTSATTYSPLDFVTREQMAAFVARLWRALGGECSNAPTPLTDVPETSFAADDVRCIYALGITIGTTPTTYSPFEFVTREQMAAFLARLWLALGGACPAVETPFVDVADTSFAVEALSCIYHLGITTGTSVDTYSPTDLVTREQMAAFLARLWRAAIAAGLDS